MASTPCPPRAGLLHPWPSRSFGLGGSAGGSGRRGDRDRHTACAPPRAGASGSPRWQTSAAGETRCAAGRSGQGSSTAGHRAAALCRRELRIPGRAPVHAGGAAAEGRCGGHPLVGETRLADEQPGRCQPRLELVLPGLSGWRGDRRARHPCHGHPGLADRTAERGAGSQRHLDPGASAW